MRVIDLVAGVALVGVVGGGVVTVTTGMAAPAYSVPVVSPLVDPAPPTELVSADPYVAPGSETRGSAARGADTDRRSASGQRSGRPVDGAARLADAPQGEFAPHAGIGAAAPAGSTGATAAGAPDAPSAAPAPAEGRGSSGGTRTEATTDIVVSSFNVLGSSHTKGRGKKRGFSAGPTRAGYAASLIAQRDVDLVGLQELERDQAQVVVDRLPGYGIFPGPQKRQHASANSIMWRTDTWQMVETHTIGIPYFNGNIIEMPYVRLRNLATGTDVWAANFHNPASIKKRGNQRRWRAEATRRQIDLANRLRAETGLPVIFTGDMNERDVYFCALVGATELEASNGGKVADGRCTPPRGARIDWVFGTPELDWQSSIVDRSTLVRRTTDHPMIVARAQLRVGVGRYSETHTGRG
jgi:hypothetical protein